MNGTVELFRDAGGIERSAGFACPVGVWEFLRELAHTFGWSPKGTTYVAPPKRKIAAPVLHNYQPGDALDRKQVDAEDALAWARALILAKHSPHFAAMINAGSLPDAASLDAGKLLSDVLDEFIEFALGGAFTFAVSTTESA